jgi:hypothetical protein
MTTTAPATAAPLDLAAAYAAGQRYDINPGRYATICNLDEDGAQATVTIRDLVASAELERGSAILSSAGNFSARTGALTPMEWNEIEHALGSAIRTSLTEGCLAACLRDRTIAALEHLDRVTFRYENAGDVGLDDPWVNAALVITRKPASLSALQRAGIDKTRVADLVRSGVLVPVLPS